MNDVMEFTNTPLELDKESFKENFEAREHIKLLLNSALGKFNQKTSNINSKLVRSSMEMEKLFEECGENIVDFNEITDSLCQVHLKSNSPTHIQNRQKNPTILAFVTARARISLHKNLMNLVAHNYKPFYTDTDSILFSGPNKNYPLEFGLSFGSFKHELGENAKIKKFQGYGRKNFYLSFQKPNEHDDMLVKIAGLSLNSELAKKDFKNLFLDPKPKIRQVRNVFQKHSQTKSTQIRYITINNVDFQCERKVSEDCPILSTKPWGF